MRRLLLLRHAKAERSQPGGRDRDRILDERGRNDARALGAYLARHGCIPNRALVSTATRTRETWALLAAVFGSAPPVAFDDRLYEAAPLAILQAIKETAPEAATLLVIGHNPGMAELAGTLVASGDVETRERLGRGFPTSALATIGFAAESWAGVHAQGGRLEHFVTPKSLTGAAD
jgi:phosphohistidine phosphatase